MESCPLRSFQSSLQQLRQNPLRPIAAGVFADPSETLSADLVNHVLNDVVAYRESRNPKIQAELQRYLLQHRRQISGLLSTGKPTDFSFVRDHAALRAQQYFPLEALLATLRSCRRFFLSYLSRHSSISRLEVNARNSIAADITRFLSDYTDSVADLITDAYLEQLHLQSRHQEEEAQALLLLLLGGYDESDRRIRKILQNAGYLDNDQSYCVAVAQSVDFTEMFNHHRARRLQETIDDILNVGPAKYLIGIHQNRVVIVFSHKRRISGWTAPRSTLGTRLKSELRTVGTAALIGVSNDVTFTALLPRAYREAQLALEMANIGKRVVQITEVPVQELLIQLAGDRLHSVLPEWYQQFFDTDDKMNSALTATTRAYAQTNMNALKAAGRLEVHPNTIYSRMDKIKFITGMDIKSFSSLTELLILSAYHEKTKNLKT